MKKVLLLLIVLVAVSCTGRTNQEVYQDMIDQHCEATGPSGNFMVFKCDNDKQEALHMNFLDDFNRYKEEKNGQ